MKPFPEPLSSLAPDYPPVKCLACGHGNSWAESSCQACGSSLDLKLCSSCEAINAKGAERCHACGTEFNPPIPGKVLPALTTYTVDAPRRRGRWALSLFALSVASFAVLVSATTLVLVHRYYGDFFVPARQTAVAPPQPPIAQPAPLPPVAIHTEPALPAQAAVQRALKEAPKPMAAKDAPKATVPPAAEVRPVARANRAVVPAHAPESGATAFSGADESKKGPAVVGVSMSLPGVPAAHPRVTHTKPMPNGATLPVAGVVASPSAGANGCSEPVAALGLCGANQKGEGK